MCIPRILALGTHSISLPLITMGSKELFAVLIPIRSSLGGWGIFGLQEFFLAYCLCKIFIFDCSAMHEFFF